MRLDNNNIKKRLRIIYTCTIMFGRRRNFSQRLRLILVLTTGDTSYNKCREATIIIDITVLGLFLSGHAVNVIIKYIYYILAYRILNIFIGILNKRMIKCIMMMIITSSSFFHSKCISHNKVLGLQSQC